MRLVTMQSGWMTEHFGYWVEIWDGDPGVGTLVCAVSSVSDAPVDWATAQKRAEKIARALQVPEIGDLVRVVRTISRENSIHEGACGTIESFHFGCPKVRLPQGGTVLAEVEVL